MAIGIINKNLRRFLGVLLCLASAVNGFSQGTPTTYTGNFFNLSDPLTGNLEYTAKGYIRVKKGASYKPETGKRLRLNINTKAASGQEQTNTETASFYRELDPSKIVGTLPGKYDISPSGGFSYRIPLSAPAGTAGVQPSISLTYHSMITNGIVGVGFNIDGMSSIRRTYQTPLTHGKRGGINFDFSDRFSIDGSNLIAINGNYGAANTKYSTEFKNYNDITSYEVSGSGPKYFVIKDVTGMTMEYGNSPDSRIIGEGSTVMEWLLSKVTDRFGNYITYHYKTNPLYEGIIEYIEYTGNDAAGLAPYNKVQFNYKLRNDHILNCVNGREQKLILRLDNIEMISSGTTIYSYRFKYQTNDLYSRLSSVAMADSLGDEMSATVFGWEIDKETGPLYDSVYTSYPLFRSAFGDRDTFSLATYGDFNGDGRTDCFTHSDIVKLEDINRDIYFEGNLYYSDGQNFKLSKSYARSAKNFNQNTVVGIDTINQVLGAFDTNGDGRDELYIECYDAGSGQWRSGLYKMVFNDQTNALEIVEKINFRLNFNYSDYNTAAIGDFDGDGFMDMLSLTIQPGPISARSADIGIKFANNSNIVGPFFLTYFSELKTGDYNGDGIEEIWAISQDYVRFYQFRKSGATWSLEEVNRYSLPYGFLSTQLTHIADFNGDGLSDLIHYDEDNKWQFYYSNGKALVRYQQGIPANINPSPFKSGFNPGATYVFCDFNRDSKTDILQINLLDNTPKLRLFSARGFISPVPWESRDIQYSKLFSSIPVANTSVVDINGDGKMEICTKPDQTQRFHHVTINSTVRPNMVSDISDGLGATIKVRYKYLEQLRGIGQYVNSSTQVYSTGLNPQNTIRELNKGLRLVSELVEKTPQEFYDSITVSYVGAKFGVERKRFLGFEKFIQLNHTYGVSIENSQNFDQVQEIAIPFEQKRMFGLEQLGKTTNAITITNPHQGVYLLRVDSTISEHTYNGFKTISRTQLDEFGLATYNQVNTYNTDGSLFQTQEESKTYTNENIWCKCDLKSSAQTVTKPGKAPFSTLLEFDYLNGKISTKKLNSDKSKNVIYTFAYNPFGQNIFTQISLGPKEPLIKDSTIYDLKGRNVIRTWNQNNHKTSIEHFEKFNIPKTIVDINGNSQKLKYDSFGRVVSYTDKNNLENTISRQWSITSNNWPGESVYKMVVITEGFGDTVKFFDSKNRVKEITYTGFNNIPVTIQQEYKSRNELSSSSFPFQGANAEHFSRFTYNHLGLIERIEQPGNISHVEYDGLTKTTTNEITGQQLVETVNPIGQPIFTKNADGNIIEMTFGSNGQPEEVISASKTVTFAYDNIGTQIQSNDPDIGIDSIVKNANGQLKYWDNKNGNFLYAGYDGLGRIDSIIDPYGKTKFTFDGSITKNGLLTSVTGPKGHKLDYTYDALQRLITSRETIEGNSYQFAFDYYKNGQIKKKTFPSGVSLDYVQDENGEISEIQYNGKVLWKCLKTDQFKNVTESVSGEKFRTQKFYDKNGKPTLYSTTYTPNGKVVHEYSYRFNESTGNLDYRAHRTSGDLFEENFTYDLNDRLKTAASPQTREMEVNYNASGKISFKWNAGTFKYESDRPSAVTDIVDFVPEFPTHDQRVVYNYYFKPDSILEADGDTVAFTYGLDHERRTSTLWNASEYKKKVYVGEYEVEIGKDGKRRELHYISGPSGIIAVIVRSQGIDSIHYVFTDHLGSWNVIALDNGQVLQDVFFEAWGTRLNHQGDPDNKTLLFDRGYTGHEHIDACGIVNMNGRLYDPLLGRMLSPDRASHNPGISDNNDLYAYVLNNPLKYTDPTGWDWYEWTDAEGLMHIHWFKDQHKRRYKDADGQVWNRLGKTYQTENTFFFDDGTTLDGPHGSGAATKIYGDKKKAAEPSAPEQTVEWNFVQPDRSLPNMSFEAFRDNVKSYERAFKVVEIYSEVVAYASVELIGLMGMAMPALRYTLLNKVDDAAKGGGRVFWSGGDDVMNAATNYAKNTGQTTLGMTRAGQNLQNLITSKNIPWSEARPMWARLSTVYAKGTKGSAHFFGAENAGSIWMQFEKPILLNNGVKIIPH